MVGKCCSVIKYVNSRGCFCEISFFRFPKNPLELVMSIGSLDKFVFDALFSPSLARSLYLQITIIFGFLLTCVGQRIV